MKIKIEPTCEGEEEIRIRCASPTEAQALAARIAEVIRGRQELRLLLDHTEHYVAHEDILFFEAGNGRVYAHTAERMYVAPYKLFELEGCLSPEFIRISKSVIANVRRVASLRRELTGNGEITFRGTGKKTYFSRGYYKPLHEKIEEMRFER